MRSELASFDIAVSAGTAEATGLADEVADAVVAAQALHWFDAPAALREVQRLLASAQGGLGLVWNTYDETVSWVAACAAIYSRRAPTGLPGHRDGSWREAFQALPDWTPIQEAHLANP